MWGCGMKDCCLFNLSYYVLLVEVGVTVCPVVFLPAFVGLVIMSAILGVRPGGLLEGDGDVDFESMRFSCVFTSIFFAFDAACFFFLIFFCGI